MRRTKPPASGQQARRALALIVPRTGLQKLHLALLNDLIRSLETTDPDSRSHRDDLAWADRSAWAPSWGVSMSDVAWSLGLDEKALREWMHSISRATRRRRIAGRERERITKQERRKK